MSLPQLENHNPLVGDDGEILQAWRTLAGARSWICWRFGPKRENLKRAKLPMSPVTGSGKNWSAPENLTDYLGALRCAHANNWSGVGLVIRRELGIVGLDLDGARFKSDNGKWQRRRWASDVLGDELQTYCEVSPSGAGYHAIAIGELAEDVIANAAGVEIYGGQGGRFLTVTGRRLPGSPDGPRLAPETIGRALDRAKTHGGKVPEPSAMKRHEAGQWGLAEGKAPHAMDVINAVALRRVDLWLPELHPDAEKSASGVWRVSSVALGRDLEEDLSIHPEKGIVDFGEHDMGDARDGKRTPIDLTLKQYGGHCDSPLEGAQWLLRRLGLFASMQSVMVERGAAFKGIDPADVFTERVERIPVEWPPSTLPAVIARQARNMAERLGVGVDVSSATILAAMAACIPSNVRLDMRGDGTWHVSAALYFALSGAPGAAKSPTIKAALAPVVAHDRKAARQHEAAMKRHQRMAKSGGSTGEPPTDRRRRVGNTTLEAAIRRHAANAAGLIVDPDELTSWLGSIDKYSQGTRGGGESGFWLSGFDGGDYSMDRASGLSVYIPRLHISILGGLTPKVLARLNDNLAEDGLIQRFIFAHMGTTRLGNPVEPDPETDRVYAESCAHLLALEGFGDIIVRPSRAAARVLREGEEWSHALQSNPTTPDVLANTAGKARGVIGRIALALHMIEHVASQGATHPLAANIGAADDDGDPMLALPAPKAPPPPKEMTEATASRALEAYRRFFWPSMRNVYERLDAGSQTAEDARAIALHLLRRQPDGFEFTARNIYKNLKRFDGNGRPRLGIALTDLAEAGWLSPEETKGRFGTKYRVNPAIYDGRFAHIGA
jgi:hypothetical protein